MKKIANLKKQAAHKAGYRLLEWCLVMRCFYNTVASSPNILRFLDFSGVVE